MSVNKRGRATLGEAWEGASVVACLMFGILAASAEAAGIQGVGLTAPRAKALLDDTSCDVPKASKGLSAAQRNLPDRGCLVSLSAVDALRLKQSLNLVDVRSPAEYDRFRIAGSINIPLHLLKTKEFLKKLPVVLVNDGRTTTALEKTCGELKQAGFERVTVLDGGLIAWRANKRPLEGNPVEQSKLNRMSAEELFEVRALSNWSVIDVSTPGKDKDLRSWLPAKVIEVPFKAKGNSIARISSAIAQQRKQDPQRNVLLIADDNDVYDRIDATLKKTGGASSVLRLDGGMKGYREHVKRQLALWRQQDEDSRPRRYQACRG